MGEKVAEGAFGRLLRYWRQVRKRSQEDVALEIDSSIKHISFLENGKSLPSRDIILRLTAYFGLSGRETNNLLAAANYAPISIDQLNVQDSRVLHSSLIHTLRGLDPFPSAIIDRTGDVRMLNRGWLEVIGKRVPSIQRQEHFNLMDIFLAEDGLKPYMEAWEDTVCAMLVALQQEVLMFQDRQSITTLQRYLADSSIPRDWQVRGANRLTLDEFHRWGGSLQYTLFLGRTGPLPDIKPGWCCQEKFVRNQNYFNATKKYSIPRKMQKISQFWEMIYLNTTN